MSVTLPEVPFLDASGDWVWRLANDHLSNIDSEYSAGSDFASGKVQH
jgi:hypothetical protein